MHYNKIMAQNIKKRDFLVHKIPVVMLWNHETRMKYFRVNTCSINFGLESS